MSTTLTHSWFMITRHLRNLARQPWWIAITLVQPIIWLLLFGAVFKATADIPGFAADSYVDFLTPGGLAGLAVLIGCSALLGGSLSALSNGMALLARKEETVIAASNFILLPPPSCPRRSCSETSCPAGSSRWPGTTRSSGPSRQAARRSPRRPTGVWS